MKKKEEICKRIRKRILLGELNPGEHLVEVNLSEQYGVSRGSIREALNILSSEGFVTIVPYKGATVTKTSTQDLVDYYHLLALIEAKAVEWTAHAVTVSAFEKLTRINDSIRDDIKSNTKDWRILYVEKNVEFHRFFWENCGNKKLILMVEEIRKKLFRYRYLSLTEETYEEYLNDHYTIINALVRKDSIMAARAMEDHILKALNIIKDTTNNISKSIDKMNP
jgi:DNA-binding GntR family transcriptional regulator